LFVLATPSIFHSRYLSGVLRFAVEISAPLSAFGHRLRQNSEMILG